MDVKEISLNKIKLGRNSRLKHDQGDLSDLMSSIKESGLLQPIGVRPTTKGGYEVCYGNRRFLAYSKLGKTSIPAVVHDASKPETETDIANLAENIQRRNISLAEVGRYIDLLTQQGMKESEVAIRLGMSVNYVRTCLTSFREVPDEYRADLDVRTVGGGKTPAGKIPIGVAQAIVSASKTAGLTSEQKKLLFKAAKSSDEFDLKQARTYAAAIKSGRKDFLKAGRRLHMVQARLWIDDAEYTRLRDQYVENGPYRSISALLVAVLRGEKALTVKIAKT